MDTKWKNSRSPFLSAIIVGMVASVIFMSLFSFFSRKAEAGYVNPLTQQEFLQNLMSANYVQYKYLREKADQTEYDYCDLYLSCETFYGDPQEDPGGLYEGLIYGEELPSQSLSSRIHDNFCPQFQEKEMFLAELSERMDYYVEDLSGGTVISNSGSSLPKAVNMDRTEEETTDAGSDGTGREIQDYVYYVSMDYDAAGNVTNVRVRCSENARQFLSRVQTVGHEKLIVLPQLDDFYEEPGGRVATCYSENFAEGYTSVRLSLLAPANMRVIYGITQQQYSDLTTVSLDSGYFSTINIRRSDFYHAGTGETYLVMLAVCALCGLLAGLYGQRRPAGEPAAAGRGFFHRIYMEVWLLSAFIPVLCSDLVVNYVYEYENNLFLRNVRAGLGRNGRLLSFIRLDQIAMFLMLAGLFAFMTLVGLGLSDIRRRNLRDRSLICRYWRRIYHGVREFCTRFYMEIVCYDIGTNANRIILKVLTVNFMVLLVICSFWFAGIFGLIIYSVIIYFILKRYVMDIQEKYRRLLHATRSIAQGNLDTALYEDFGVFESYKSELRQIQADFKHAVEEEVKSQRMKSELITNVSHDLKTPLTAIITYIDLLKEPDVTEEKQKEYLEILHRKADRLKVLIEDLFEISKASSKTVSLQIVDVDICNLLRQVYLEQEDRAAGAGLDFKFSLPEERIILPLDSQKTYRIFDNLYTNIIKYAMPGTRVYVNVRKERGGVSVELKNISAAELTMDPGELTERFVRGDGSRNTEGSGLGLAIAKSFAELQGGSMQISFDGDLFKCLLRFSGSPSSRKWNEADGGFGEHDMHGGREGDNAGMYHGTYDAPVSQEGYSSGEYTTPYHHSGPSTGGYREHTGSGGNGPEMGYENYREPYAPGGLEEYGNPYDRAGYGDRNGDSRYRAYGGYPPYHGGMSVGGMPVENERFPGDISARQYGNGPYGQDGYGYGSTWEDMSRENAVMYGRRNIRDSNILNGRKKRRREKEEPQNEGKTPDKSSGGSGKGFFGRRK